MLYEYYQKVVMDRHLYNATEIATMAGIKNMNGKPHSLFVSAFLNSKGGQKYYYPTKKGLMQVFGDYSIIQDMLNFLLRYPENEINTIRLQNKNYKIVYDGKKLRKIRENIITIDD